MNVFISRHVIPIMSSDFATISNEPSKPLDLVELLKTDNEIKIVMDTLNDLMVKRKEIVSRVESKRQMLSQMSHDLRTPLNSIIGFSELLIDGMNGTLNHGQAEFVRNIHESAIELLGSIEKSIIIHDRH